MIPIKDIIAENIHRYEPREEQVPRWVAVSAWAFVLIALGLALYVCFYL